MDIRIWIPIYGCPYMDIHIWISIYGYPYMDIHIWISIYGYPHMDIHIWGGGGMATARYVFLIFFTHGRPYRGRTHAPVREKKTTAMRNLYRPKKWIAMVKTTARSERMRATSGKFFRGGCPGSSAWKLKEIKNKNVKLLKTGSPRTGTGTGNRNRYEPEPA